MINSSAKIDRLSQLNDINVNHNYRWCTYWLRAYKHLCNDVKAFLLQTGMTEQDILDLKESDEETLVFVQSQLGYVIMPEHFYDAWIDKGADFSYGDITTAIRNFQRLNHVADSPITTSMILFETNIGQISNHSSERTQFVRKAMSKIYEQEA